MRGMEKQHSSFVSMLMCMSMVSLSVILYHTPPVAAAAGYTVVVMLLYRICGHGYSQIYPDSSEVVIFIAAIMSAIVWPLYFLFGACMFLGMVIRGE
jgi:hypothetical protein